jgi:hypothetical protein
MAKHSYIYLSVIFACLCLTACVEEKPAPPAKADQTVFMYLPWSGDLTSYFYRNVEDFKSVIKQGVLKDERVIVFFSTSSTEATLYELVYQNGSCVEVLLKSYTDPPFTTPGGITSILNDVKYYAPANRYGMVIGCHGMGWLPVEKAASRGAGGAYHWEYKDVPLTRFFGGNSSEYQTEITDLAQGITNAGIKMEYILFDDCYMSSIETAFELKEVTDHVIASPTEIMAYGMPYARIGQHLIGQVNYAGICEEFYQFYSNYEYPYGTIGITKCSELDNLATVMKEINGRFPLDDTFQPGNLQRMDGYTPVIFFDYGDYAGKLCTDKDLLDRFKAQLERTVPSQYRRHTPFYYSMGKGAIKINTYSGTTISDPSTNPKAVKKTETAWYKATHN